MAATSSTTFRVYRVEQGRGHQPVCRAGKPINFRSRDTANREASKHGPKALVIPVREGE